MRTPALFLSAATIALIATPAAAQDVPAPSTSSAETASDPGQEAEETRGSAGDIVVTATRRAERLADVPVAVSAVSQESLQLSGANDIRQLNQLAPSLLVSSTGSEANGSARVRGIGTVGDNPGLESSVAVFIDGVYRSRSGIGLNELGEVERVEVLRGPQGTLSGRNASAGVINIISRQPSFSGIEGMGEITYGNYDLIRGQAAINLPLGDTLAVRVDGIYTKRDGFYYDPTNNTDVNDRDRYFVRGQLRFQPSDALNIRIIGDFTRRDEKCCAATYVDRSVNEYVGNLNDPATPLLVTGGVPNPNGNNIVNVIRDLGQPLARVNAAGYDRTISTSLGRSFAGVTEDKGISGQIDYDFGGATLTSITAYRDYKSDQGSDTDYSQVDILYRAANGNSSRQFKTFSQELRLQGEAFGGKLDWLVGGYYADEDLEVVDNLRFGNQYGRFATCRIISGSALAQFYTPGDTSCLSATGRAVLSGVVPGVPSPFGAAGPTIVAALGRLDAINDRGSTADRYLQNSRNYAFFTHNIIHFTDRLDLTLGVRYTNERKKFSAAFTNDNVGCVQNQQALAPFLTNAALAATAGGILALSCQGNSTAELNGVTINDRRSEDEFTGTAVLSYKPADPLLIYASYSRGYKAGGFNLDRSALKNPILPFAASGGAQALTGNLQFDPEKVNAYEIGAKYSRGPFTLTAAAFRQEFENFQLNTFNGTVFLVATVNSCKTGLNGGDRDTSATTGACAADDVTYGLRSQGIELEASLQPARDVNFNIGLTYSDTKFRNNLVGSARGLPLDPALRKLPGDNLSNAPEWVATSSFAWTPELGSSGLSGLFYIDGRLSDDYNTGSDLFPQKEQDSFFVANARIGIRGDRERWALEFWGQNIFNKDYAQVAFNSPFQQGATSAPFVDPQYPGGRQIFSQYLAEPRTYGITGRVRF
ncbi:Outer membrane receptor proteins, mostly Fe transport [Sphingomonas guangdongensis]|uniref:Outer membrane receptor proteins, mostly Fe transport n=1 Tax=Sphingomonas guangdongensis TaxID=1141890 RepID=A0A285QB81_9SPHN|nr:TonB-dependent receptor [Sphingomonas guangdongensis]SOB79071.1 Outer membrane receptor proteins, mostly Fe transport [Sphingomonas guangdongensis]